MAGYNKEFLLDAYISRFLELDDIDALDRLYTMATEFYDKVGKDKFRVYASLDAEAIRKYKQKCSTKK
jgi:hypothetical protein